MRDQMRTLRALAGLAGAVAGSAASIAVTCCGHGTVGVWLRPPHGSFSPGVVAVGPNTSSPLRAAPRPPAPRPAGPPGAAPAGGSGVGITAFSAVVSCACVTDPDLPESAAAYQ